MGRPYGSKPAAKKAFSGGKGKKKPMGRKKAAPKKAPVNLEITGMESLYLKDLIAAETIVAIKMTTGGELRGVVQYYDKEVFSIGPEDGGSKILIPKSSICYMYEVEE